MTTKNDTQAAALAAALHTIYSHPIRSWTCEVCAEDTVAILAALDGWVLVRDSEYRTHFMEERAGMDATIARLRAIEEAARAGFLAFEAWAHGERDEWAAEHAALRAALAAKEATE